MAFLTNRFKFNERVYEHKGICFIARIRNKPDEDFQNALKDSGAHLVSFGADVKKPDLPQMYQSDVYDLAVKKIDSALNFSHQDHEIDTNENYRGRYIFHSKFTKPLLRFFSSFIGKHSITDYERMIEQEILGKDTKSLLDVACGENLSLVDLVKSEKLQTFVGNDISWSQIELVDRTLTQETFRDNRGLVLFTNNDGRRLPFGDNSFDTVICKNVLHHMPDLASVVGLLSEVKRVGKKSVIVEVMDPKKEGSWARLRHKYYIDFLKDAGGHFLSIQEFAGFTNDATKRYNIPTIRGVYQVAVYE